MKSTINILGKEIPRLGMGCWAIGGTWSDNGSALGWAGVTDESSIKALNKAYEMGIRLFDTAAVYGYGHSEMVLNKGLSHVRKDIIIATKFGYPCDSEKKIGLGENVTKESIVKECEESLRRLGTDYIDIYQLHVNCMSIDRLPEVVETLDSLKQSGKIRSYGWSNDDVDSSEHFINTTDGDYIQFDENVFRNNAKMIELLDRTDTIGFNRQPLAMGLLTGKFNASSKIGTDDIRGASIDWLTYFDNGVPNKAYLDMIEQVKSILTADGKSLAQGALSWILGSSPNLVPIPGFKKTSQVIDNIGTLDFDILSPSDVKQVNQIISDFVATTTLKL